MDIRSSNYGQHVVEVALAIHAPGQIREPIIDADYLETIQSVNYRGTQIAAHDELIDLYDRPQR